MSFDDSAPAVLLRDQGAILSSSLGACSAVVSSTARPTATVAPDSLKFKNPEAPAVKREAEEDWGKCSVGRNQMVVVCGILLLPLSALLAHTFHCFQLAAGGDRNAGMGTALRR
jgi:hypothetical protein